MAKSKRRRGKHANRTNPKAQLDPQPPPEPQTEATAEKPADAVAKDTTTPQETPAETPHENATPVIAESPQGKGPRMVLTSDKRRGVYHCDYCHADISQEPRIRCAVCPDFDLCLDCFATTNHSAAIARLKVAATVHDAVSTPSSSMHGSGISSAAANHDDTHGYRVCDSTRYALFPSKRKVVTSRQSSYVDTKSDVGVGEKNDVSGTEVVVAEEQEAEEKSATVNEESSVQAQMESKAGKTDLGQRRPHPMDIDKPEPEEAKNEAEVDKEAASESNVETDTESNVLVMQNDPKWVWTAEEDLRLLDAIKTHGLGNWTEISEAVSGPGSTGKTAKRCMERFIDDFLGRYGHILPAYTIAEDDGEEEDASDANMEQDDEALRSGKRPLYRSQSTVSVLSQGGRSRKKARIVPTSTLPDYDSFWPDPHLPPVPGVQLGQNVGREQSVRAEQAYVKLITQATSKEEAEQIHREWKETRLNQPNGPTVLPPLPENLPLMPGSDLAGYMPRRGDFDMEFDNEAEAILADMEFSSSDLPQDRQLKLQIIEIYNAKLDERERRKKFLLSRNLLNYRQNQQTDPKMPRDERDLVRRMRLFERLHTPEEHQQFIADILKAKRLRKEIAKLQLYRRMGIQSLEEAEKFELDKNRREFHKMAQIQREAGIDKTGTQIGLNTTSLTETESSTLWKQYRTNDRTSRRSLNRSDDPTLNSEGILQNVPAFQQERAAGNEPTNPESASVQTTVPVQPEKEVPSSTETAPSSATTRDDDGFDIVRAPGYELLSAKEVALCRRLRLLPSQYLDVKTAIIHESLQQGLLDKESVGSSRRAIVKIDATKKGEVIDFMVRAGWVSSK